LNSTRSSSDLMKLASIIASTRFYTKYKGSIEKTLKTIIGDKLYSIEIEELSDSEVKVKINGEIYKVKVDENLLSITPETPVSRIMKEELTKTEGIELELEENDVLVKAHASGKIIKLNVNEGDDIDEGTPLIVLEAMKMELDVNSPIKGKIKKILVKVGDEVKIGDPLIIIRKS